MTQNASGYLLSLARRNAQIYVARCHKVVADLEERTLSLLDGHDPAELGMKAIMGLLSGIPLHGDEVIEVWHARAANFSDQLARGMVEHYLREIFPLWYFAEAMERRDCAAWAHQTLAQTALNVIGVLAGLNRQYYVPFQFKRARHFIATLAWRRKRSSPAGSNISLSRTIRPYSTSG